MQEHYPERMRQVRIGSKQSLIVFGRKQEITMPAKVLFRLFGVGKIPAQIRAQLDSEGVILQDEGLFGSTTFRKVRRPGYYAAFDRRYYFGSLTITQTRLVGLFSSNPVINVPFADSRFRGLDFARENANTLRTAFDASLFHDDWSGKIEYRFRTPQVQAFLDTLNAKRG